MKVIATNRTARFNYELLETYEAGIILKGTEIKSVRLGKVSIQDTYVRINKKLEAYVVDMHISPYHHGTHYNHDEKRVKKLLLNKRELIKINNRIMKDQLTVVPTKIYLKEGLCKLEIAIAKGKKQHDKRQSLKEKDMKRRMDKELNRRG